MGINRPDLQFDYNHPGGLRQIHRLSQVGGAQVFRLEGWTGPLLVSGEIHDALEHIGATGTRFEEV